MDREARRQAGLEQETIEGSGLSVTRAPQARESRGIRAVDRARLAVVRNIAMSLIITLGCVLLILIAFNRPLVYRIFPWVEPQAQSEAEVDVAYPGDGIYTVTIEGADGYAGMQLEVVDPTLRPDLNVTVEFTFACGCKGSFVPAYGTYKEKRFPEKCKADNEKAICPECRRKLEYAKQREELEQEENTGE